MSDTTASPDHSAPGQSPDHSLQRSLGVVGLTMFGLTYLVPLTIFTTYGIVAQLTGGRVALAYIVTLVAMIFTAYSYTHMVRAYPVSGSAYTYTQRTFGGHVGFLAGWALLLDYLFLPMINYLVIGIYLNAEFTHIPIWVWIVISLALVTVLNLVGITSINRANNIIIAAQVIFIAVFLVLSIRSLMGESVDLMAPFTGDGSATGMSVVFAGAAILCLSFLGFDAVSTLAEEARNPKVDIPRAILLVTVLGGVVFIVLAYLSQIVFPGTAFDNVDAAAVEIATKIGGNTMANLFLAAYVAGAFGSALTSQASVSRILFAMGRDGVLPRPFGGIWDRYRTPAFAVLVVTAISLLAVVISLGTLASLISFGALVAFTAVNLAVIKHYWFDAGERSGSAVIWYLIFPLIGFALTAWLWTSLSGQAIKVGLVWLVIGALYLGAITGGFRRQPPQMDMAE